MSRSCHRATFSSPACALRADDARQAADLLGGHGIALVRHGRRSLLLFAEKLLGLADLGALQVADLGGDLVECRGDHGERPQIVRVAVALDDLRRNRGGFQSQARADLLFEFRREMGEDSHGAGELAHAHVFGGGIEARDVALRFRIPVGQFESEGDGLGVDAVGAADHGRVFEFPGAAFEHFGEALKIFRDDGGRLADQQGLRGIDHVVGSEAVVKPARIAGRRFRRRRW